MKCKIVSVHRQASRSCFKTGHRKFEIDWWRGKRLLLPFLSQITDEHPVVFMHAFVEISAAILDNGLIPFNWLLNLL